MKQALGPIGVLILLLHPAGLASAQAAPSEIVGVDDIQWVNPPEALSAGVTHDVFLSASMDREIGYSIYLPPGYEESDLQYPVVYWLHGRSGNESDTRPAEALRAGISAGRVDPLVLVMANGGVASGYIDNPATGVMGESVVVRELIPHIEATYRVHTEGRGRGVAGFSMGGAGAVRTMIRQPELFSTVVSLGGVMVEFRGIMERNFVTDERLAMEYDPYPNSIDGAPAIRPINMKLLVGADDGWLADNRRFAAHLGHQNLFPDYREIPGLEHDLAAYLDVVGLEVFQFFSRTLADPS